MAYRQPQSTIYLFKGCPCDTEYNNTIYFATKAAQWTYFKSLPYKALTAQSYQRYGKGVLRIRNDAITTMAGTDSLYDYNYMMFCNDGSFNPSGNPADSVKMFYCFINSVEYVNENTTAINYTIDVIQTYMFDYKLGYCFVDREHSITDSVGDNLIDEPFNPKLYTEYQLASKIYDHQCIQIKYSPNLTYDESIPDWQPSWLNFNVITGWHILNGSAAVYSVAAINTINVINKVPTAEFVITIPMISTYTATQYGSFVYFFIDYLVKQKAVITDIQILPYELCADYREELSGGTIIRPTWNNINLTNVVRSYTYTSTLSYSYSDSVNVSRPTVFYDNKGNTYTPINNKLLSFPYQKITITNSNGQEQELAPEMFNTSNNTFTFNILGCTHPVPEICMYPYNYNKMEKNLDRKVSVDYFCSGTWSEDSAARYWTENKNKIALGVIGGAVALAGAVGISIATGGSAAGVAASGAASMGASVLHSNIARGENLLPPSYQPIQMDKLNLPSSSQSKLGVDVNPLQAKAGGAALSYQIANLLDTFNKRDTVMGSPSFSNNIYFADSFGFKIIYKSLLAFDAQRIDNFFSMYGYAVKDLKIPNLFLYWNQANTYLRPLWNYIKNVQTTIIPYENINPALTRFIPEDAEHELKQIYNNGITFWMTGGGVGNYDIAHNLPRQ